MRIISPTPYLAKNTPFAVISPECKSDLEMAPVDVFVDTVFDNNDEEILLPTFTCPVCTSMAVITAPTIPRRVLEIWRAEQPV